MEYGEGRKGLQPSPAAVPGPRCRRVHWETTPEAPAHLLRAHFRKEAVIGVPDDCFADYNRWQGAQAFLVERVNAAALWVLRLCLPLALQEQASDHPRSRAESGAHFRAEPIVAASLESRSDFQDTMEAHLHRGCEAPLPLVVLVSNCEI